MTENAAPVAPPPARPVPPTALVERAGDLPAPLPASRTPLVGREQDVAAIGDLLRRDDVPLVVLTGPGGVGKTRLALAVARAVEEAFADGVCFVALETIRDPELVVPMIAQALGVRDVGTRPLLEQLAAHLRPRQTLLLLDNLEQVVEAAADIADLLTRCPRLTVLATSRVVLRLSGEHDVPVAPLPVPAAVHLFVARARAANPVFALTAANQAAVAAICARLDGLPLAIELAAARTPALPPPALLARLTQALSLLTRGARDQPDRLRTMRGAIAWSYDLLAPAEQVLFRRLAVFVGGFGLKGAEAVAGVGDGGLDALDGIASLVEKSIVQQIGGPLAEEPRYRLLETVREFGLERLAASGEERAGRAAHAAVVTELAEHLSARIWVAGSERVLAYLDAEHDNVRTALAWAEAADEAELGLRLAGAMAGFWLVRGHYREGRGRLERALSLGAPTPSAPRAWALFGAGMLATVQEENAAAVVLLDEAIRIAGTVDDRWTAANALKALGRAELQRGDYAQAALRTEEAIELHWALEATAVGGPELLTRAYAYRGLVAYAQGELERAATCLEEVVRRQRALGFTWGLDDTLRTLGDIARDRSDHEQALAFYRESIELARGHGDPRFLTATLVGIADVSALRGRSEAAVRLAGAVTALREQVGLPGGAWPRATHDRALALARAALAPEAFVAAWEAGTALSLEQVVVEALEAAAPAGVATSAPAAPDPVTAASLTAREAEVLRLLAQGLSDREIAEDLSLSPRTIGGHVTNLLTKLDLDSRTAAAIFAVRHGLA